VPAAAGRPRYYCSDRCRYADRKRKAQGARLAGDGFVPAPSAARRAELALALAGAAAAAPEDRLATLLLELLGIAAQLEHLERDLEPTLRFRSERLRRALVLALDNDFGEVIRG
jgi:hypothetical protein